MAYFLTKLSRCSRRRVLELDSDANGGYYGSVIPRVSRVRLTTWALIAWSAFGAAAAYSGYRSVMASCPAFDDFAGCFEPPYRFAAGVFFVFWGTVEAVLVGVWLVQRFTRR